MTNTPLKISEGVRIDLSNFLPGRWANETSHRPFVSGKIYQSAPGQKGKHQTHGYEEFLRLIYKYAVPLQLVVMIESSVIDADDKILWIFGRPMGKPNAPEKSFSLLLKDAVCRGVLWQQLDTFRQLFEIRDGDAKFYSLDES